VPFAREIQRTTDVLRPPEVLVKLVGLASLCVAATVVAGCSQSKSEAAPAARQCARLLKRVTDMDANAKAFGVANKEHGGTIAQMWRGFARMSDDDARVPIQSTDPKVRGYEKRLVDVRARAVGAFSDLAAAKESGDTEEERVASARVKALGAEWRQLEDELHAGCP
jgi:hypothetical protein